MLLRHQPEPRREVSAPPQRPHRRRKGRHGHGSDGADAGRGLQPTRGISQRNEKKIATAGLFSKVHFHHASGKPLPTNWPKANAARSRVRSAIEQVFADQKRRMGLFVRTIGIARACTKTSLDNLAYNLRRYLYLTTATKAE